MLTFVKSKTYMIYAPNLDRTHELDMAAGLKNWVEDLGFLLVCAFIHHVRLLMMLDMHVTLTNRPKPFISSRELSILFR